MKLKLLAIALVITGANYGQGKLLNKALSKVAKVMGTANDQTTTTLNDIAPIGGIGSNLGPADMNTFEQSFFKGWKPGGDLVAFTFSKKATAGFYKIDGTVTSNGVPLDYLTSGTYSLITEANSAPRKIELSSSSGQKASFTIAPSTKKVKLVSINGQKDNISIDPTKDVVLELETAVPANTLLKISLAITQVGIKSFVDACFVKSGPKITIPAAAFRNINLTPGGKAVYSYKNCFLQISFESLENATDVSGSFQKVEYRNVYYDGKFVNITTEPVLNPGLTATGTAAQMDYTSFKPNAFLSRPLSHIKKIGIKSFAIRGTTYKQTTETSETSTTITTTTTTLQFPKQPNEVWDALMEKLYPELMAILQEEIAPVLPVETVTNAPAYSTIEAFAKDDINTKVEFERAYKNTKVVSAFLPISEGFGSSGVNEKLMNEIGADALATITLDLEISEGGGLVLMSPKLALEISGKSNGFVNATKYCTLNIKSSKGTGFSNNITPAQLEAIVRKSDLMIVFRKALQDMKAKEKTNLDYEIVWNMQN